MLERDYLMRLVRQVSEALARSLTKKHAGELLDALQTLDTALDDVLGPHKSVFEYADVQTVAHILQAPERIRAAGQLLSAKADLMEAADAAVAARWRTRALALLLEAGSRQWSSQDRATDATKIEGLVAAGAQEDLEARHRELLTAFEAGRLGPS